MRMRRIRTLTAMCVLALAAVLSVGVSPAAANPMPTIVLVHGAFADTTSWDPVAAELRGRGHDVVVSSNPLRGPGYDSAAIEKALADIPVRCCWSGTRTAVSSSPTPTPPTWSAWSTLPPSRPTRVSPRRRRSTRSRSPVASCCRRCCRSEWSTTRPPRSVRTSTATSLRTASTRRSVRTSPIPRPPTCSRISDPSRWRRTSNRHRTRPGENLPTWAVIPDQDRVIPPASERFMAERAGAQITEIPGASHAVLVSQPAQVADVIERAAAAV
ncbi:alpha/beta fold hydrolase [Rhodococcus hoagii]|nr:alpha/beta fold hydrolase [Prescottella equi]